MMKSLRRPRRIIAIVNRKGGVGKSATAANLGAALALRNRRVLIIDTDSQRNVTTHLGDAARRDDPESYTINEAYRSPSKYAAGAIGPSVEPGVDLMYGSSFLEDTEKEILTMQHATAGLIMQKIVKQATTAAEYDYVLIDCPPAEGLLTRNALVAADMILMPVPTDYSGFEGMGRLKELLNKLDAQEAFDDGIPPVYALPYLVDAATTSTELRDYMHSDDFAKDHGAGAIVTTALRSVIHRNQAVRDCYGENASIFRYVKTDASGRKRSNDDGVMRARREFAALAEEIESVCS